MAACAFGTLTGVTPFEAGSNLAHSLDIQLFRMGRSPVYSSQNRPLASLLTLLC